jgi:hypothetical protein
MLFGRPDEDQLDVPRTPVPDETCPACASARARSYPVLRSVGWHWMVRCQDCLTVLRSQPAPTPFGFTYLPYSAYLRGM